MQKEASSALVLAVTSLPYILSLLCPYHVPSEAQGQQTEGLLTLVGVEGDREVASHELSG